MAGILDSIFRTIAALTAIAIAYASKGLILALGALPAITALQFLTTDWIVRRRYGRLTLHSIHIINDRNTAGGDALWVFDVFIPGADPY